MAFEAYMYLLLAMALDPSLHVDDAAIVTASEKLGVAPSHGCLTSLLAILLVFSAHCSLVDLNRDNSHDWILYDHQHEVQSLCPLAHPVPRTSNRVYRPIANLS